MNNQTLAGLLSDVGVKLRNFRAGHSEKIICPKCRDLNDHSLSVTIDPDGEGAVMRCHRGKCGWQHGVRISGATKTMQRKVSYVEPPSYEPRAADKPDALYEFCESRGISSATADKFGLYVAHKGFYDREAESWVDRQCVVFPYFLGGRVVNRKFRAIAGKQWQRQEKDPLPTLFNVDSITSHDEVIWVEGEWDVLACAEAGFRQIVSLKDGAPDKLKDEDDPARKSDKRFFALETHVDLLARVQKFILAGDNDSPGLILREELARRLGRHRCWTVTWPEGCKDANDTLMRYGVEVLHKCVVGAEQWPMNDFDVWTDTEDDYAPPAAIEIPLDRPDGIVPLGFDDDLFYYYSISKRRVAALTAPEHTAAHLTGLASLVGYWETLEIFKMKNGGLLWYKIADWLMTQCRAIGIFSPDRRRGRGAWVDGDRIVMHVGDCLMIDGKTHPLNLAGSRYIYEMAETMIDGLAEPLSSRDAHWLHKISKLLRWEVPSHGTLFAGWLVIAPICGALRWRPSIYLTAGSGSGKSYIMEHIVSMCLGKTAVAVAGSTTEPGIRQALKSDARPIIFDEAEPEDRQAAMRMQQIFSLVRVSSSENSPDIVKGTTGGREKKYRVRSCFLFQAINTATYRQADENRITVLSLRDTSNERDIPFADLDATIRERITENFAAQLLARSVSLVHVIRANSETFASAISSAYGSRRIGDQIGTLLAGAYSLHSTECITPQAAAEFIARDEWKEFSPDPSEKDEYKLLRQIMSSKLKVGTVDVPISRLYEDAQKFVNEDHGIPPEIAQRTLKEAGFKWGAHENVPGLFISTNHPSISALLKNTQWSSSWGRSLSRIPSAIPAKKIVTKFALGHQSRAVFLPNSAIDGAD